MELGYKEHLFGLNIGLPTFSLTPISPPTERNTGNEQSRIIKEKDNFMCIMRDLILQMKPVTLDIPSRILNFMTKDPINLNDCLFRILLSLHESQKKRKNISLHFMSLWYYLHVRNTIIQYIYLAWNVMPG